MEKDFNSTQPNGNPSQVLVAIMIGAFAVGIVYAFGWAALLLTIAGGAVVWHRAERKRLFREAEARASAYLNICGPVVLMANDPNETAASVISRAAEFREQLRLSGNPYADIIPVIPYPFAPMMYGYGELTMSWNRYQREAGEKQCLENNTWVNKCPAHLRALWASQVLGLELEKTETI